uniref:Uncharacterized protein n=1 Tax=Strongyloides stercoralis TaxID=6248 RepID=A0AAF5CTM2_STRER
MVSKNREYFRSKDSYYYRSKYYFDDNDDSIFFDKKYFYTERRSNYNGYSEFHSDYYNSSDYVRTRHSNDGRKTSTFNYFCYDRTSYSKYSSSNFYSKRHKDTNNSNCHHSSRYSNGDSQREKNKRNDRYANCDKSQSPTKRIHIISRLIPSEKNNGSATLKNGKNSNRHQNTSASFKNTKDSKPPRSKSKLYNIVFNTLNEECTAADLMRYAKANVGMPDLIDTSINGKAIVGFYDYEKFEIMKEIFRNVIKIQLENGEFTVLTLASYDK